MSKNSLLLVDPGFKADESVNCHLLLKITGNSFSYAIINKDSGQISVIFDKQGSEDIEQDLKTIFQSDKHLSLNFEAIKAAVHTANFIFIPDELYDAENLSSYAKYLAGEEKIYTKNTNSLGFKTLFSLEEGIKNVLPESTDYYPQSAPLLVLSDFLADEALLIDFTSTSFNVLYVKDKKVHFQNHYQSETAEEFNYFLLLIIDQLGLNESLPVYLQGIVNEDDDYYNCLLKYFNQLYFFLPTQNPDDELLADMPKHYFSGLLALDLCE